MVICGSSFGELSPALSLALPPKRARSTPSPESPASSGSEGSPSPVSGDAAKAKRLAATWSTYADEHCCVHVVGYTEDVPFYMRLADVLIGKPGPGVISEGSCVHILNAIERRAQGGERLLML